MHRNSVRARIALLSASLVTLASSGAALAQTPTFSIGLGVRETNWTSPVVIGGNGGQSGGIEFIGYKPEPTPIIAGYPLVADGTWQTITFTFGTDAVRAFAGASANGVLLGTTGTIEHLGFQNTSGVSDPISLYIDDVVNTPAGGSPTVVENFEAGTVGAPSGSNTAAILFANAYSSGSTQANILSSSANVNVVDVDPGEGTKSYRMGMRFIDSSPNRWARLSSFGSFIPNASQRPNPAIDYGPGSTLSFKLKAVVTPVPQGWNVDADGDWSVAANWLGTVPNSATAIARFGGAIAITAPRTVTVDAGVQPVTVAGMVFTSDIAYTINASPGNGILLRAGAGFDTSINAERGSHVVNSGVETNRRLAINVTRAQDTLELNGVILNTDIAGSNLDTAAKAIGIVKSGAGLASVTQLNFDTVTVSGGTLKLKPSSGTTELYHVSIAGTTAAPTAKLDITNNAVVLDYGVSARALPASPAVNSTQAASNYAAQLARIKAAYNGGAWDGNGITSSLANSSHAIGIAEASELGYVYGQTWNGAAVDDSALLIRLTLAGDFTLDGTVNFDDLLKLAANYNVAEGMTWTKGDANYDGAVNFDDLLKLASNYNQTVTGSFGGDWALAQSAVPEPTSLLAAACAGLGLLSRRRRK